MMTTVSLNADRKSLLKRYPPLIGGFPFSDPSNRDERREHEEPVDRVTLTPLARVL